jgi:type VI secretion system secreted protein Hcp
MANGDMFLRLDSQRAGVVKGESVDATHPNEIQITDWSWGMTSSSALGGSGAAAKTALSELHVFKRADTATTGLMSVMRSNDLVKKAVLTVRKAGSKPIDYLVITIERGRITGYDIRSETEKSAEVVEHLTLTFEKIDIAYHAQDDKGQKKGGSNFTAEIINN